MEGLMQPKTMETYTTSHVARATGASYRQLDYWLRTGVIDLVHRGRGSGDPHRWSRENASAARVAFVLARCGATCPVIRAVVARLQEDPGWWDETALISTRGELTRLATAMGRALREAGWVVDFQQARLDVGVTLQRAALAA